MFAAKWERVLRPGLPGAAGEGRRSSRIRGAPWSREEEFPVPEGGGRLPRLGAELSGRVGGTSWGRRVGGGGGVPGAREGQKEFLGVGGGCAGGGRGVPGTHGG